MHLVLGLPEDSCCRALLERFAARGHDARLIASPFEAPARIALRIGADGVAETVLALGGGAAEPVDSVFVRARAPLDPAGWAPADYGYMQAETQASLLGWLTALDCPVVNRLNAELWYRPRTTLLHWLALLRGCGLPVPETIVSDSVEALTAFRARLEAGEVPGAVLRSLSREGSWLVAGGEWGGVRALQAHGPVCLAEPHAAVRALCVVGARIVWNGEPAAAEAALAERLMRFARMAGLAFVEIALGEVRGGPAVVQVDPLPRLENFGDAAQRAIVEALADLLTGQPAARPVEVPA